MLRQARLDAGLSQWDVARKMDVPQTVVSKIELGTRRVDVIELISFSKAVGFDAVETVQELQKMWSKSDNYG